MRMPPLCGSIRIRLRRDIVVKVTHAFVDTEKRAVIDRAYRKRSTP
jgi:hypothetical protein